jgi:hypothetical protein
MLDLEQIQLLDNNAKERYMLMEKLFEHPGFKFLLLWAKAQVEDATTREMNAANWEQVCFLRGARMAYSNFVNIEEFSEREFAIEAQNALERKFEDEQNQTDTDGE